MKKPQVEIEKIYKYQKSKHCPSGFCLLLLLPSSVLCIGTVILFKGCPEFNITAAFHTDARNEIIAVLTFAEPLFIEFTISLFFFGELVNSLFYAFECIFLCCFVKQKSFTFRHII